MIPTLLIRSLTHNWPIVDVILGYNIRMTASIYLTAVDILIGCSRLLLTAIYCVSQIYCNSYKPKNEPYADWISSPILELLLDLITISCQNPLRSVLTLPSTLHSLITKVAIYLVELSREIVRILDCRCQHLNIRYKFERWVLINN